MHRNIGLKALQLFQSFSEDNGATYQENAMGFYDEMEQSLVNGELPKKHRLQARVDGDFEDKRYKADYLRLQIHFFDQLKYLSIKLKSIAIPERLGHLRRKLEEINQWIEGDVRKQVDLIPT